MISAFSPFLAVRYLLLRRINLLGVFGVMFAAWAMIVVNSVFSGFVGDIRDDVRRSTPAMLLTDLPHDIGYERLRAAIESDPAVAATAPRLRHYGMLQSLRMPLGIRTVESSQVDFDHNRSGFALLLGIDPLREERVTGLRGWLERTEQVFAAHNRTVHQSHILDEPDAERRSLLLLPDAVEWRARSRAQLHLDATAEDHRSSWPGLLLGWRRYIDAPWLQEGDPIDLLAAAFVPDRAGAPQLRTHRIRLAFGGWFATGHRMFDETSAMLPIETLRTLLGQDLADPDSIDIVTDVAISLKPEVTAAAAAECQVRLRETAQRLLPPGSGPCNVLDWEQQNSVFLRAVAHEHALMQFVLFVVMLVAAFVIYATLHMMVVQKWKDIGILSSLGGSPRDIGAVFLICGFAVAATGAVLGTGLGVVSVLGLNTVNDWLQATFDVALFPRQLFDLQRVPFRLEIPWIATVALGAVLLALLVALVPARKAARMNPVTALSYE